MVVFNELRITEDGQYLVIDTRIRKDILKQFRNAYIKNISVCDSSLYEEGTPNNAVTIYDYSEEGKNSSFYNRIHFTKVGAKSFRGKLLFIYVEVGNVDETALTCGCSSNPTIGVTVDMKIIYDQFMRYINELSCYNQCSSNLPQGITDFILRFNAFLLAIDSKHYTKGIEFFDKWFNGKGNMSKSNCGCHG